MPTNDFKPFAVGGSATVVSQATWAAAATLLANGFQAGVADPNYLNKAWRQSSIMSSVIGALIVTETGLDVVDDGTTATILANLIAAIKVLASAVATSNASIVTVGGSHTLTATEYAASFITVTGVLASDATLVFPTATGRWTVINNTTGAHTLTCQTLAGHSVLVTQAKSDTIICDGVGIQYATADAPTQAFGDSSLSVASTAFVQAAISAIGGYYVDTGAVNAYVITTVPPTTSYVTGDSFRIRITNTNNGASTLNAGAGAKALLREDQAPVQSGDVHGLISVTYDSTIGAGSWLMNGEAVSELGALAKLNIGQGLENDGSGNLRVKLADASLRRTASGLQENFPEATFSGARALALSDHGSLLVATAVGTLTMLQTTATWNGYNFTANARGGAVTVTPNAADKINNGTVGASYSVPQGTSCTFVSDGAGNVDIVGQTNVPGQAAAPQYINTSQTLAAGVYNVDTSAGALSLTMPAGASGGSAVVLIDYAGSWGYNNVTLIPSGSDKIDGIAANFTLDTPGATLPFAYTVGTLNWDMQ